MRRSDGFTLIELHVVISIVALMIALLLPALGTAKEQARRAVCGSQLRQNAIAIQNYAGAHRDWLPASDWRTGMLFNAYRLAHDNGFTTHSSEHIMSFGMSLGSLSCPSGSYKAGYHAGHNFFFINYAYNGGVGNWYVGEMLNGSQTGLDRWSYTTNTWYNHWSSHLANAPYAPYNRPLPRFQMATNPSKIGLMTDLYRDSAGHYPQGIFSLYVNMNGVLHPFLPPNHWTGSDEMIAGGSNVAYADLSVVWRQPSQLVSRYQHYYMHMYW